MSDAIHFLLRYASALTHLVGVSMLLGGGLAVAVLRISTRRAPIARDFFQAANMALILFFWTGLALVVVSGLLLQFDETGAVVPDSSTSRGLVLWLKGLLLLPVIAKSAIVTYYAARRPHGRTYPVLHGAARAAFIGFDLVLVVAIVMLGVWIHLM